MPVRWTGCRRCRIRATTRTQLGNTERPARCRLDAVEVLSHSVGDGSVHIAGGVQAPCPYSSVGRATDL